MNFGTFLRYSSQSMTLTTHVHLVRRQTEWSYISTPPSVLSWHVQHHFAFYFLWSLVHLLFLITFLFPFLVLFKRGNNMVYHYTLLRKMPCICPNIITCSCTPSCIPGRLWSMMQHFVVWEIDSSKTLTRMYVPNHMVLHPRRPRSE